MSTSSTEKHGVFLSFRGGDTRRTFTSHLYAALCKGPFKTFIDYDLEKGENAWPSLSKAIEESRASIVVFSENYASSKWCMEELVKILDCREKQGQVVIPIFYKVTPSRLRDLTGSYQKAFDEHKIKVDRGIYSHELLSKWKNALKEAADMTGHHTGGPNYRDDSHLVKDVYNDVLQKLEWRYPQVLEGLVGTERNCRNVEQLLLEEENRKIGIWGMAGIGKTTIAKFVFAKLFPLYDYVCFVEEAKQYSGDKLMREILRQEISSSNFEGPILGLRRLSGKKVFIVLDDMDSAETLQYVCREYANHLDSDSKLVVTTKDRQLLVGRVDRIHKVKTWKKPESLELFCLQAFKESHPPKEYEHLIERVLDYAGGLPLALQVLGSHLHDKGIAFWDNTLGKLEQYPNNDVQNVLKVSYDGLHKLEKAIFLEIAFFYKGIKEDHVIRILDACDLYASSGVGVLMDKALITVSKYSNKIQMHGLLQQMAFDIVRQECDVEPRRRSRLRDDEAHEVIEENVGTYKIQGISLDLSPIQDLHLCADTFKKMRCLRFLRFYASGGQSSSNAYADLPRALEAFGSQLRYFEWVGYPFTSLPFQPSHGANLFLVEIHLPHSKVEKLWEGTQKLDHLEGIDLRECKQFKELPDLSKAPILKWVNLSGSESLEKLHPSLLSSATLVTLMLDRCTKLKNVKCGEQLKSLKKISVNGCSSLKEFEISSELVENLNLSNTGIQSLDTSIGRLVFLKWLKTLKLPDSVQVVDKHQLRALFDGLQSLEILHMKCCSNLFDLPDNINCLSKLYELRLDGSMVKTLPESIKFLRELEILSLENCRELVFLPELPPLIERLCAANCTSLMMVSNLKTLATNMMGKAKLISFKNCLMLDEDVLKGIMDSLHLTMMSSALHNLRVTVYERLDSYNCGHNYNRVELCLPGSRVPGQVKNQRKGSSMTVELPNSNSILLVGFIFSVVLSPAVGIMKKQATKIEWKCHGAGILISSHVADITELKSSHVFVWYEPLPIYGLNVHFEFRVVNDEGEVDGSICIKECGVHPLTVSELLEVVLPKVDLEEGTRKKLNEDLEREYGHFRIERPDEEGNNSMSSQMHSKHQDTSVLAELDLDSNTRRELEEKDNLDMTGMTDHQTQAAQDQIMNDMQETTSANEGATSKVVELEQSLAQLYTETDDLKAQLAEIKAKLGENEKRKKELKVALKECKKK